MIPVKRVLDYNIKVQTNADGTGVDFSKVKMAMNPFDEIAVEEAVAVSCGTTASQEQLRTALALGPDRAILVEMDAAQAKACNR